MIPAPGPEPPAAGSSARPPWIVAGIHLNARYPGDGGRVVRTEVDLGDVRHWDELARHLVQAHGGEADALTSYRLTLDQVRFAHADTHLALAFIGAGPPDGHTHPRPMDAGEPTPRLASYFPLWSSPAANRNDLDPDGIRFPAPSQTGLPHTGIYHVSSAELADWAAGRLPRRLTSPSSEDDAQWAYWAEKLGVTEATRAEWITTNAGRASARWRASTSFPAIPAIQGTAAARRGRSPSRQVLRQARGRR